VTPATVEFSPNATLAQLLTYLQETPKYQYKKPSLRCNGKNLYMRAPPVLEEATRPNLEKKLSELVEDGDSIGVTDPSIVNSAVLVLKFV